MQISSIVDSLIRTDKSRCARPSYPSDVFRLVSFSRIKSAFLLALLCIATLCTQVTSAAPRTPVGINISGPADWNQEHPFVDVFRFSRSWISQREGTAWGKGPPLKLDGSGWVTSLEPNCYAETPMVTHGGHPPGEYTVLYQGKGRIEFNGDASVVSNAPGRILINTKGSNAIFLRIRETEIADPLRNIRVIMPGHEATCAKSPWNPAFINHWRGMAILRFMDLMRTNNSPLQNWSERPQLTDATWSNDGGVPIEILCDLSNELDADPWFCIPHQANDDFVRKFAQLVQSRLNPKRTVWIEYSNEIWNSTFSQTKYVQEEGQKNKLGEKPWEAGWRYGAVRSLEIFKIWEDVFGGPKRLKRVLGTQAANDWISQRICETQDAGKKADALAIAPYISYMVKGTDASTIAALGVDGILDQVEQTKLAESIQWMRKQKKVADQWGLTLVSYEAGQHLVGIMGGENHEPLTQVFMQANRNPRMGKIYQKYIDAWADVSNGGAICMFSSCGNWGKWGSWGLLESASQDPSTATKYSSTMQWASEHGNPIKISTPKDH